MLTTILIICFALGEIPHQPLCLTELYQGNNVLWKDLRLSHSYSRQDEIFLFPDNFYGNSEIYSLGLFVDLDKNICNDLSANDYRILYQTVPETDTPSVLILGFICVLLMNRNVRRTCRKNIEKNIL
jgi:hypothetical protein